MGPGKCRGGVVTSEEPWTWWRVSRNELAKILRGQDFGWSLLMDPAVTWDFGVENRAGVGAGQQGSEQKGAKCMVG